MKAKRFVITIKLRSATGQRPEVRTLGGDTIFCSLTEGMTATWRLKEVRKNRSKRRATAISLPHEPAK